MWYNLMSDEQRQNTEFIYNLSYGKDSMAGLHVTIDILGIPVSRIVHAEVWATDTIPADLPPMVDFKIKADAYIKERWGLTVEHIYATRANQSGVPWAEREKLTYEKLFYHVPERKDPDNPNRGGGDTGWPYQQGPWCQKLKVRVHNLGISNQVEPVVQQRSQDGSYTAFPSAVPTEGIGALGSSSLFRRLPATRSKKKYRAYLRHRS